MTEYFVWWRRAMRSVLFAITILASAAAAEDLQCLKPKPGEPAASTLFYSSLQQQAYTALDRRHTTYEELKTEQQIAAYQQRLKALFTNQLGGFPDRTPLNSRIVGKLAGDGCQIEKVIFESQPHHHVTATLYLPNSSSPYPAVLISSGHSRPGKAADY